MSVDGMVLHAAPTDEALYLPASYYEVWLPATYSYSFF